METIAYTSANGHTKPLYLHKPQGDIRGVVQLVHGMAEHCGRYTWLSVELARAGYAVARYNLIGHGPQEAGEQLGYFGDSGGWDMQLRDMHTVHALMAKRFPGMPFVLLGHSMGSFLAREYVLRGPSLPLDALVLSGTGWQNALSCRVGMLLASALCALKGKRQPSELLQKISFAGYNKAFMPARTPNDWLSRDARNADRYEADPLCGFALTGGAYHDLFAGLFALTHLERLTAIPKALPLYLLSGDADPVGHRGKGVQEVVRQYKAAGISRVSVMLYPGGRHEMFNEINRAEVSADLIAWLAQLKGE